MTTDIFKDNDKDISYVYNEEEKKYNKINNINNEILPIRLIDYKEFNNGDLLLYNGLLFVLLGDYLLGIDNFLGIKASSNIKNQVKKINIIEYTKSRKYLCNDYSLSLGGIYSIDDEKDSYSFMNDSELIIKDWLSFICESIICKDVEDKYEDCFESNEISSCFHRCIFDWNKKMITKYKNNIDIIGFDNNYIERTLERIDKSSSKYNEFLDKVDYDLDKAQKIVKMYESTQEYTSKEKRLREFEKSLQDNMEEYESEFGETDRIVNNILTNSKVKKQLKQGVIILNSFMLDNSALVDDDNKIILDRYSNTRYYDFSFLITNFVKATEMFFSYKMSKLPGKIFVYNSDIKERIEVDLCSDEFKEYSMLGEMINFLENNIEMLKDFFDLEYRKRFLSTCRYWKDHCRNGYFHKHSVDSLKEAFDIILTTLSLLVEIELYIK